jgi:hypothetical protein
MGNFISTNRNNPCPVCGDTRGKCRHVHDSPDMTLCMTVTDSHSTPPGFKFIKMSKDGLWGILIRDEGASDEGKEEWIRQLWLNQQQRLKEEKSRLAQLLSETERDRNIHHLLSSLSLSSSHREDLRRRGLSEKLIDAGFFRSVERWQQLSCEVSHRVAGVSLHGRSLTNWTSGYICPLWNPKGEIITWQLKTDRQEEDLQEENNQKIPKYLWATSSSKRRPGGPTAHLSNGELPLTYCTPVAQNSECDQKHHQIDNNLIRPRLGETLGKEVNLYTQLGFDLRILTNFFSSAAINTKTFTCILPSTSSYPSVEWNKFASVAFKVGNISYLNLQTDRKYMTILNNSIIYRYKRIDTWANKPETDVTNTDSVSLVSLVLPVLTYIGIAEGVLKPWIISQLRSQIVIGAAGGNFAGSPQNLREYLEEAAIRVGSKDVLLWADAGAVLNRHVMRQYRRTYDLIKRWGFTMHVAWWGQLEKSCADPDEYTGEYEILTWAQFESLSRQPSRFWDDIKEQLQKVKHLLRPRRGFQQRPSKQQKSQQNATTIIYIPGKLPTYDEYIKLGCPKIIYQGDERVTIWQEAVSKGWQHILDGSAPGLGKSHTAGSMKNTEFDLRQLWYLASDHRNPTTLTVEQHFIDVPPRHNGLAYDYTRLTPMGQPFLVHPQPENNSKLFPSNCFRTHIFGLMRDKNIKVEGMSNPVCAGCHLLNACRSSRGPGFGYRFERYSVFGYPQLRAHPDSLPTLDDYEYSECGLFWDEASQIMRSRKKVEVSISDFNQTVGELAVSFPELFNKLNSVFEKLRFLLWGEEYGDGMLWSNENLPTRSRYGYNDTAIRKLLGEIPQDIADIISEMEQALHPDLSFLRDAPDKLATTGTKAEKATSRRINNLLRGQTYTDGKEQLKQILLNWLVPLLEVWAGYSRGSLHFDKGILSIHLEDNRHREVATAAKFNIYLDGTLDVKYLALKLAVGAENILQIEQVIPSYNNLTVVHVTGMGVLGRDRRDSMLERVSAIRESINNKYLGLSVAVIERKAFAQLGDGYHFRDGRGVNRFQDASVLMSIGIPYPNLGELAAEYQILTGAVPDLEAQEVDSENLATMKFADLDFQEFIDSLVRAEILQESGRLRSHLRPEEELIYYFVGDFDVGFLERELFGCKFQTKRAIEIDWRAADYGEQTRFILIKAIGKQILSGNENPTQQNVVDEMATFANQKTIKQSRVSQIVKEMSVIGGWKQLRILIVKMLNSLCPSQGQEILESHEMWLAKIYFPLLGEESPVKALVNLIELTQVVGIRFGAIFQQVSLDVRSQLLGYVFALMKVMGLRLEFLVEELQPMLGFP